jgi:enoyl-CoA hydratase/carnithine racemase
MKPLENTPPVHPNLSVDPAGIGWLVFDDPEGRVNILTRGVLTTLRATLAEARDRRRRGKLKTLVLWSGKKDTFLAGAHVADIEGIQEAANGERGARWVQALFQELADLPVPTLAAIHGTCLGGGLEMALACDVRVVSDAPETRLGFPEVLLGILPAFGGTIRSAEIMGLRRTLALTLSGRRVEGREAVAMGLAHQELPAQGFRARVEELAKRMAEGHGPTQRVRNPLDRALEAFPFGRRLILARARQHLLRKTGGHYPAPMEILNLLERCWARPTAEGLAAEAEAVGRLLVTPVCKNLIHLFHLREAARKGKGMPGEILDLPRVPELGSRPVNGPALLVFRILGAMVSEAAALEKEGQRGEDIEAAARAFGMAAGPLEMRGRRHDRRLRRGRSRPELEERLILAMVNEASRILEEDGAIRAGTVDLAMVVGGGFPPFRGGLLRHADSLGLGTVVDRLHSLSKTLGPRLEPTGLLADLARSGHTFYARFP